MEVNKMIFNTLKTDTFQDMEDKNQLIEIKIKIPKHVLEKAIKDALKHL